MDDNRSPEPTWLDLYDYRQQVAAMYRQRNAAFLRGEDDLVVLRRFQAGKDALFAMHPQSPFDSEQRSSFSGLDYFPYNPALRLEARLEPAHQDQKAEETMSLPSSGPHSMPFRLAAHVYFQIEDDELELPVYWIDVYGGGLFLPFRDTTCPAESYGGGRYLFDTVKGSDFLREDAVAEEGPSGYEGGRIILDFNYAYNPSCAYDPRWVCPLAPLENRLQIEIRAGERKYHE